MKDCLPVKVFAPVNELLSASKVEEAAPESEVRKPLSLLNQESLTEEDAMVFTCPFVPVKAKP